MIGFGQDVSLTAQDYFDKAYNNKSDWQYQIYNYTQVLRTHPDNANTFTNFSSQNTYIWNYKYLN